MLLNLLQIYVILLLQIVRICILRFSKKGEAQNENAGT
mgnify:FL=1